MKAIMLSINPKWCEKIISVEKTVEVRKTKPKLEPPFKCFIYCTKPSYEHEDFFVFDAGTENSKAYYGGGKVIGEFMCDQIYNCDADSVGLFDKVTKDYLPGSCMNFEQICSYAKGMLPLYGWHISDLVIYDKPKDISSFRHTCPNDGPWCTMCRYAKNYRGKLLCGSILTRPPQSWCYVEEKDL